VQSIGGGGGDILSTAADGTLQSYVPQAATGGGGGNGGATSVTVGAAIGTTGAGANGVVVQSIGGGGGVVGSTNVALGGAGSGGAVGLTVSANVITTGAGASALVAQSQGGAGAGPITVNIGAVNITGGLGGSALSLLGGTSNTVTTAGTLTTADGQTGTVITATGGNNAITNYGLIVGSIDLGSGNNSLTNAVGGAFLAGPIVNLGSGTFFNSGLINPGGANVVKTLTITGNLNTTATSQYNVDLDLITNTSDKLMVSGTAALAGTVNANVMNIGYAQTGMHDAVIVRAAGGITSHSGLTMNAPTSAVVTYSLAYPNATDETLHYVVEYAPTGLTGQQKVVGSLIDRIQATPTAAFSPTAAVLVSIPTVSTLGAVYDSLSGEGVTAGQSAAFTSVSNSLDAVDTQWTSRIGADTSGRSVGGQLSVLAAASGAKAVQHERIGALWLVGNGGHETVRGSGGSHTERDTGYGLQGGWDIRTSAGTLLGLTIGGGPQSFTVSDVNTVGKVQAITGGAYAGFSRGPWMVGLDVLYTSLKTNYTRTMVIPGFSETAHGQYTMDALSGRFQLSTKVRLSADATLRPIGMVEVTRLNMPAYTEASTTTAGAAGILNLRFGAKDFTRTRTFLGSELTATGKAGGGFTLAGTLRANWIHDFNPMRSVTVGFASVPTQTFDSLGAAGVSDMGKFDAQVSLRRDNYEFRLGVGTTAASRYNQLNAQGGFRIVW
jgi:outer membrane autotransporter protein